MWKVKSKEFENRLKPVVMQCNDILSHIASFQMPPVYPWMLELADAGPGVGVSSAECRWRLLETGQEFITVTKCFVSTEQERIRAKTKRKGSLLA